MPITFAERERGASKMSSSIVREALWRVTVWGVRRAGRRCAALSAGDRWPQDARARRPAERLSTLRTLGFAAAGALLLVIVEITVFVLVAHAIGWWWAVLAGIVTIVLGGILPNAKGSGRGSGSGPRSAKAAHPAVRPAPASPGSPAALLLLAPGFVTDAAGLLLLIPPVRAFAGRQVRRATEARISAAAAGDLFGPRIVKATRADPPVAGPARQQPGGGEVLQGEVVEGDVIDPQHRHHNA